MRSSLSQKTSPAQPENQACGPLPRRFLRRRKLHGGLTASQSSTYKGIRRAIASSDGACSWSVPRMAHHCGISVTQFQRDRRVLEERSLIVRIERRGTKHRSDTNLWKLPNLATPTPLPLMAPVLKLLTPVLKTTTRGSGEPGGNLPVKREAKARPANHPPEFRRRWEQRQKGKALREGMEERARQRCRRAVDAASVGLWVPPPDYVPPTEEQIEQMQRQYWQREREREQARLAETAERDRVEQVVARQRERERIAALCPRCGGCGRRDVLTPAGRLRFVDCECKGE